MKSKSQSSCNKNTWGHVRELREKLESEDNPILTGLEQSWQLLQKDYGKIIERGCDESSAANPLAAFQGYLEMGFYPPPEVLLSVAGCFEHYFEQNGRVELEEVFFSSGRKKGVGNYAAQKNNDFRFEYFRFLSTLQLAEGKSQAELAKELLQDLNIVQDDVYGFLRGYRRWVSKEKKKHRKDIASSFLEFMKDQQDNFPGLDAFIKDHQDILSDPEDFLREVDRKS